MGSLNLEGDLLQPLSAGEQNEWWGLGFWVVQGMLGSVGFSLAVGQFSHKLRAGWGRQRRGG